MSEPTQAVSFQPGEGQPSGNALQGATSPATPQPGGQPEQRNESQPQFLTKDEFERAKQEIEEKALRRAQGLIDKADSRIMKKVREDLKSLEKSLELQKKAGLQVTPEMETRLKQQVWDQVLTEVEPDQPHPTEPPKAQPNAQQEEQPDPITAEAWQMMQAAGIVIEVNDPEAATLDMSSPYKFFRSIEAAIEAKRQRTQGPTNQPNQPPRTPTNLGGSGGQTDLMRQYQEEATKLRGDTWAITQLQRKYRGLGLKL